MRSHTMRPGLSLRRAFARGGSLAVKHGPAKERGLPPVDGSRSVPGGRLLDLQKLTLDRAHSGHQAIEFDEQELLVLPGLLHEIGGGAVADPVKGIGQPPVQMAHGPFQIQKLLV